IRASVRCVSASTTWIPSNRSATAPSVVMPAPRSWKISKCIAANVHGFDDDGAGMNRRGRWASTSPEVAIVGSGFAGIAAGVKLRRAGIESFTIYEKSLDIGGTWRDNTY